MVFFTTELRDKAVSKRLVGEVCEDPSMGLTYTTLTAISECSIEFMDKKHEHNPEPQYIIGEELWKLSDSVGQVRISVLTFSTKILCLSIC